MGVRSHEESQESRGEPEVMRGARSQEGNQKSRGEPGVRMSDE